ncbi:MAG: dihydrolipoyl dehydrogenase, partial [Proteocatella sp.]
SGLKKDMAKIIERKNKIKDKLINGIEYLMNKNSIDVINGNAEFLNDKEVFVKSGRDEYTINAENIIIATGSKISNISVPGIEHSFVMDSKAALENKEDMDSVTIIGAGVIGMEFAFIYANLGIKVNVVEYCDRVLNMIDSDISCEIRDIAESRGIGVYTQAKLTKIAKDENGKAVVFFETNSGEKYIASDKILMATGRSANFEGLNIEKAGIELNERKNAIQTDTFMRTNVENIYAIGDVNGRMQLAHVASHEGIIAVDNIMGKANEMHYDAVPNVIFTSPEIANVGMTEDFAKANEQNIKVSKFPFAANGKALTMNEEEGFVKLIKDMDQNKIIGASIIGPDASSLISTLTVIINCDVTEEEVMHTIFAHPTTGEAIHESVLGLGMGALHYHE